jgi:type IV pilus assembly protein PilB
MLANHDEAIYGHLAAQDLVRREQLDAARAKARAAGRSLADTLIADRVLPREILLERLAEYCGWEFEADLPAALPAEAVAEIPAHLARSYGVIPLRAGRRDLDLLTADPFNLQAVDDLTFALGREVRLVFADPDQVEILIRRHYGGADGSNPADGHEGTTVGLAAAVEPEHSADDLEAMAGQAPIIRFVHAVLAQAVREKASDIHFEPFEDEFKIRYRVDGALYELRPPPRHFALPVISRLKVIANLNIAERRLPQDGRLRITLAGRAVDLRVSTLPTQFGESVVLRVLDQSAVQLELGRLGLPPRVAAELDEVIRRPNGLFLVTGPTGSGKTTTLYGALRTINRPELKLLTVEDPVEYEIEGVMQVPLNPAAGLTFASALRSFLRQDPDVVMVGEIRDLETAQIALQASLTGHLVLSTLHTSDAAGAIARLIDLGVEPFLIAASLQGVLAQRLVRRICPHCRETYVPSPEVLAECNLSSGSAGTPPADARVFHRGRGCTHCNHTGYQGRIGIFEWLRVTDDIRTLIGEKAPRHELRLKAVEQQGLRTLRDEGLRAVFEGLTTIEEVGKYT